MEKKTKSIRFSESPPTRKSRIAASFVGHGPTTNGVTATARYEARIADPSSTLPIRTALPSPRSATSVVSSTRRPDISKDTCRRLRRWMFLARLSNSWDVAESQREFLAREDRDQQTPGSGYRREVEATRMAGNPGLGTRTSEKGHRSDRQGCTCPIKDGLGPGDGKIADHPE